MKIAFRVVLAFLVAALAAGRFGGQARALSPLDPPAPDATLEQLYVYRVFVKDNDDIARLNHSFDVLESRGADYVNVLGDATVPDRTAALGLRAEVETALAPQYDLFTYYGGYRTVNEHYAHLDSVAAAYPDLTRVITYGVSWRRAMSSALGNDLKVMCITKIRDGDCALSPNTDKPRFFLMAAIHARELTTSEMAWRWIDWLVDNYDVNPDITALLDHNEMWVVPVINPDGRNIVEQGGNSPYFQRKNANNSLGVCSNPPTSGNQHGVDLNRNANFGWGGVGTSTNPCSQTYLGVSAASEPEEYYLEALMSQLFRDQRGPNVTDAAPMTTTGAMLTVHTYSDLVLLPWGNGSGNAPNDAGLRSLAFRMSYFNNYLTGRPGEVLYPVSGATDDWAYGMLGIASFTFEIGPGSGPCAGFMPTYSCQDSTFWPLNRDSFMYLAKSARQPYASPLGPSALTPTLSLSRAMPGWVVTLTATLDDSPYGNYPGSVGRPSSQPISAAQVFVDTPPWLGGAPIAMTAGDGSFDSVSEAAKVALDTSALAAGRHTLFVRGQDNAGNWGPTTAQWLWVGARVFVPAVMRDVSVDFDPED